MQLFAELESSKTFTRNGSPALHAMDYLSPVVEAIEKAGWEPSLRYSHKVENTNLDGSINVAYGRVLLEAKIPSSFPDLLSDKTVGFVYALDKQTPEFIVYGGHSVRTCTNLAVYDDEMVRVYKDNHYDAQKSFEKYIEKIGADEQKFVEFHNRLQNFDLGEEQIEQYLGKFLQAACTTHTGIGISAITHAAKQLFDQSSPYSIKSGSTNMWNMYNAITDYYSQSLKNDKGLFERPKKTKELFKFLSETSILN